MGAPAGFGAAFFGSLRGYRRTWLWPDLVAGLTVWAILVPESLAYAVLAGVPPAVGLWAAPAALVLYAALGSSRHLVVGPMSATSFFVINVKPVKTVMIPPITIRMMANVFMG